MKRRYLVIILVGAMTGSLFAANVRSLTIKTAPARQEQIRGRFTAKQKQAIESYGSQVQVKMDRTGVPSYLMGLQSVRTSRDQARAAQAALSAHGDAFRRRARDGFTYRSALRDDLGIVHVRMDQTYNGIPVIGGEMIVHMTRNRIVGFNGRFLPDLDLPTEPAITSDQAGANAVVFIGNTEGQTPTLVETRKPVIFVDEDDAGHLAIPVRVSYAGSDGVEIDDVFVDAMEGNILGRHPLVWRSLFRRIHNVNQSCDEASLPGTLMFQEGGSSSDSAAMGAYDNTGKTYQYYLYTFQRDSYNNAGAQLVSSVHVRFPTSCTPNNAQWSTTRNQMSYGDGDGVMFGNLSTGLDVTAHELTHGVTQFTSNLTYSRESGALNEGASDILGESAAFYWGQGDWKIGAEVFTPGTAGDALRYMYNPTLDGSSADYYPERLFAGSCTPSGSNDNCGVHSNSGIANLFFYLLSQGGSHPRQKTSVVVTGVGIEKAQRIWYRALVAYMTSSTNFQGARNATAQAAADFFGGACTAEWTAVQQAWDAVGVPGGWSCSPPTSCDPDGSKQEMCFQMGGIHFDSDSCICCTSFQITDCFVIE
jgi:bacillolysin